MNHFKGIMSLLLVFLILFIPIGQAHVFADEGIQVIEQGQDKNVDENIIRREDLMQETEEAYEEYKEIIQNSSSYRLFSSGNNRYEVAIADPDGTFTKVGSYSTFSAAKSAMDSNPDPNAVVRDTTRVIGNQVVAMKNGVVVITSDKKNKSVLEFKFLGKSQATTYVENRIDAFYFDSNGSTVTMGISGQLANDIPIDMIELVPINQGLQSYYTKNSNGDLVHAVARYSFDNSKNMYIPKYESFTICEAPSFMETGKKYYSMDGINFYEDNKLKNFSGAFYPYYKFLSLRSKTAYTAEELDKYINSWNKSNSVLNGKGATFIKAQNEYGVNAALLLAMAANESGYGTSRIAREKNNIFGIAATDSNPYGDAYMFESVEACIMYQADRMISRGYLDANTDYRYFGSCIGDKKIGLNVKYGSDPYWGEKIAGIMYRMDKYLGGKDYNNYQLALTNKITFAYKNNNISSPYFYKYSNRNDNFPVGMPALIIRSDGGWYELQSDMGIDEKRTTPAHYSTKYNFDRSKAYGIKDDFDLINKPDLGWRKIKGTDTWYYIKPNGEIARGNVYINGKCYAFKNTGDWIGTWIKNTKGWWMKYPDGSYPKNKWVLVGKMWYHFNQNGYMDTGWQKIGGIWYYFKESGEMATGWIKYKDKWYYLKPDGSMTTGEMNIAGTHYVFSESGDWTATWKRDSNGWWLQYIDGSYPVNKWVKIGERWYHFNQDGYMDTGWKKIGGKMYYFRNNGAMVTGEVHIDGRLCAFSDTGIWIGTWMKDDIGWRLKYTDESYARNKWELIGDYWYHFNSRGYMDTGWQRIGGKWYYFQGNGRMATGWKKINEEWYFMDDNGSMQTGWILYRDKWYYANSHGVMQTGWVLIGGKWYYFYNDGSMAANTTIDGYKLGSDGAWVR